MIHCDALMKDLLLVDDHPIIVVAVRALVEAKSKDYRLHTATTRDEALAMLGETKPDVAIVDLNLPDGDGLSLIRELRSASPDCRVLVFSMQCELKFGPRALKAGAHGYLMKGADISALYQALAVVASGKSYCSDALAQHLMRNVGVNGGRGVGIEALSEREFQIFQLIGRGLAPKEIASFLRISPKTVDSHRENMKAKLQCASTMDLAFLARDWFVDSGSGPTRGATLPEAAVEGRGI